MFYEVWNKKETDGIKPTNYFAITTAVIHCYKADVAKRWGKLNQIPFLSSAVDSSIHNVLLLLKEPAHNDNCSVYCFWEGRVSTNCSLTSILLVTTVRNKQLQAGTQINPYRYVRGHTDEH